MEDLVRRHFEERVKEGDYLQRGKMILIPEGLSGKLLDVGCGATPTYSGGEIEIFGVDITPKMAKIFQESNPYASVVIADAKALPFREEVFDFVVANALLHHLVGKSPQVCLYNVGTAVDEMKHVTKPKGRIAIRELMARNKCFSLLMFYITYLCAKLGIEIELLDVHSNVVVFFLERKKLEELSEKSGLRIISVEAKDWRPFARIRLGSIVCSSFRKQNATLDS